MTADLLNAIDWQRPLCLGLVFAPFALHLLRTHLPQRRLFKGVIAPHLLPFMTVYPDKKRFTSILSLFAWSLAVVALAGPTLDKTPDFQKTPIPSHDIVVLMDISPSMRGQDIYPNRLTRAKKELQELTFLLNKDRVALIAYSNQAYLTLPFTDDLNTLLHFSESLDTDMPIQKGSNLIQAFELSRTLLPSGGNVVLLTDGGFQSTSQEVLASAQRLADANIRLFALGIGQASGYPVLKDDGELYLLNDKPVVSKLNRELLINLTALTGGRYSDLSPDNSDWMGFTEKWLPAKSTETRLHIQSSADTTPLFPGLLAISLLLFIGLHWSNQSLFFMAFMALMLNFGLTPPLSAGTLDQYFEYQGEQALKQNNPAEALTFFEKSHTFRGLMGVGISHYKQQRWQEARTAFERALMKANNNERVVAFYNLGNALAQQGQYKQSYQYYRQALMLDPNHKRSLYNANIVLEKLNSLALPPPKDQHNKPQQKKPRAVLPETDHKDHNHPPPLTIQLTAKNTTSTPLASEDNAHRLLQYRFRQQDKQSDSFFSGNPW